MEKTSFGPRRCGGVSCQGCPTDIASAGRIRHIVRLCSSASQFCPGFECKSASLSGI
jgi:hypothetical protein